jgi:Mg-chelatase subunit ChlD
MVYGDNEQSEVMANAGQPPASAPAGWKFCDAAPPASRWRELVSATDGFLATLQSSPQQENVALVTYNESAVQESPLSSDYTRIPRSLDVYTQHLCAGLTNIHDGIAAGINALNDPRTSRPWAVKVLIVLTDGRRTAGPDPVVAAQAASQQGIMIYAVTFSQEADQALMQKVAAAARGVHYHVSTSDELQQLFKAVAKRLPTLLTR